MKLEFGFGTSVQNVELPDENCMGILLPEKVEHQYEGEEAVRQALRHPVGAGYLKDTVRKGQTVAIVTSDVTRPCPSYTILPSVLDELYEAGIRKEDITVVFALGSHRKQTAEEHKKLVGERVYNEVKCVDSDPDDCISFGRTSHGTPVDITRSVAEADFVICLGNIEYHYFAGFSGGVKAIMPGVSTRSAIQVNHSMMIREAAHAGKLDGNPIREDIEEAGRIFGVDYIVNVVLDEHKKIIHAVAGDPVLAHRQGCAFLEQLYKKPIAERADIVLVSQGGAPKDLNLYQTQKALDNAKHAVKDGGIIILIGSCKEGLGEKTFGRWISEARKPSDLTDRVKTAFELGGHKAAAIAMVLEHARVFLVSEMDEQLVRACFLEPYSNAQAAFDEAFRILGSHAKVLAMPYGGSTLPVVTEE